MATYVYRDGVMVDKATLAPMNTGEYVPVVPMVIHDIAPYLSTVTGEYVSGRKAKADDLAKNNCIDAADMKSVGGGKFKSKAFAKKRGLTHLLKEGETR